MVNEACKEAQPQDADLREFSLMDLEQAYGAAEGPEAADAEAEAAWNRLRREALAFRSGLMAEGRAELDAIYGHHPHHAYDLFWPQKDAGQAVALFIHGGFWQRQARETFSHMAAGLLAHGVPVAVIGMRSCPEADLNALIGDVRQMAAHLFRRLARPLVAIGHGSGAHLAACLVATDWKARGFGTEVVSAGMGISGIYDLRPLLGTSLKEKLKLDTLICHAASPLLWPVVESRRFLVCVGGREAEAWRRQSLSLAEAWQACGVNIAHAVIDDADHLSILDGLAEPAGILTRAAEQLCTESDRAAH